LHKDLEISFASMYAVMEKLLIAADSMLSLMLVSAMRNFVNA